MDPKHIVKNRKVIFFLKKMLSTTFLRARGLHTKHYLHSPGTKVFELKQVLVTDYRIRHCFLQEEMNYRIVLDSQIKKLKQQVNNETRVTKSIRRKLPNPNHLNKLKF